MYIVGCAFSSWCYKYGSAALHTMCSAHVHHHVVVIRDQDVDTTSYNCLSIDGYVLIHAPLNRLLLLFFVEE